MVGGERPLVPEILGQPAPVGAKKNADFEPIIARSALAVTSSQKSSINANRKSTTRFLMSLKGSSPLSPPKGPQKRKTADFREKSHFV